MEFVARNQPLPNDQASFPPPLVAAVVVATVDDIPQASRPAAVVEALLKSVNQLTEPPDSTK